MSGSYDHTFLAGGIFMAFSGLLLLFVPIGKCLLSLFTGKKTVSNRAPKEREILMEDPESQKNLTETSVWVGDLCQGVLPHTCEEISFLNFLTLLLNCKSCVLISIFGDCLSIYMCIIWWIHFGLAYIIIIIINFIFSFTFMAFFNLCLFKKKEMLFELEWVKLLMIVIFFFLVIVKFVYFLECYRNIEDILISTIMVAYVFTWIWYE